MCKGSQYSVAATPRIKRSMFTKEELSKLGLKTLAETCQESDVFSTFSWGYPTKVEVSEIVDVKRFVCAINSNRTESFDWPFCRHASFWSPDGFSRMTEWVVIFF